MTARYTATSSWYQEAPSATTAAQPAAYSSTTMVIFMA